MIKSKTREELIKMYIECLKGEKIPWRQRWNNNSNRNGITNIEYKGVNKLILQLVSYKEHYEDPRWLTFIQIKIINQNVILEIKEIKNKLLDKAYIYILIYM